MAFTRESEIQPNSWTASYFTYQHFEIKFLKISTPNSKFLSDITFEINESKLYTTFLSVNKHCCLQNAEENISGSNSPVNLIVDKYLFLSIQDCMRPQKSVNI